jgi:hypothetical protein
MAIFAPAAFAQQAVEDFSGKVDSIDRIDPERGDEDGSIIVIGDAGKTMIFDINAETAMTDESSNKLTSYDIADGDTVKVSYSKTDGRPLAVTISKS